LCHKSDSNLFVIGDPNQAIYGFRGADVQYIRRFLNDYPEAKQFQLQKSYRCSRNILKASQDIIADDQKSVAFLEGLASDVKITISEHPTDKSEAEFVARSIEQMMGGVRFFSMDSEISSGDSSAGISSLSDFAIFCRTTYQMNVFEKALKDHGIPCQSIDEFPFLKKPEFKSLRDLISATIHPENKYLRNRVKDQNMTYLTDDIFNNGINSKPAAMSSIRNLVECYINEHVKDPEKTGNTLLGLLDGFENPLEFYEFLALGQSVDIYEPEAQKVALMTLHASKGLEFSCVFVTGCEDGLIPYHIFPSQQADPEEEQRLLYVGMTRASNFLYLSHAHRRHLFGRSFQLPRSPFLQRIEKEFLDSSTSEWSKKPRKDDGQLSLF
jgi:superfamily I DNA/RNA helicase